MIPFLIILQKKDKKSLFRNSCDISKSAERYPVHLYDIMTIVLMDVLKKTFDAIPKNASPHKKII